MTEEEKKQYKLIFKQETKKIINSGMSPFPLPYGAKNTNEPWKVKNYTLFDMDNLIDEDLINISVKTGKVSKNLVCLDFDCLNLYNETYKTYPKFRYICDHTHKDDTSRGKHIFIRTPEPIRKHSRNNLDILGSGANAIHSPSYNAEKDYFYKCADAVILENEYFVYTLESFDEIDFMDISRNAAGVSVIERKTPIKQTFDKTGAVDPKYIYRQLRTAYQETLQNNPPIQYRLLRSDGTRDLEVIDRSRADQALLVVLVKNGYEFIDAVALYECYSKNNKYLEKKKTGHHKSYLELSFNNAEKYYLNTRNKNDEDTDHLFYLFKYHNPFTGRSKTIKKLILLSMLYKMKIAGRSEIDMSIREIEIYSGASNKAIIKNLHDLINDNYIIKVPKEKAFVHADSYRLNKTKIIELWTDITDKKEMSNVHHIYTCLRGIRGKGKVEYRLKYRDIKDLSSDPYAFQSMNKNSDILIDFINNNQNVEFTMHELIKYTGMSTNTIKNKLDKLKDVIKIKEGKKKTSHSTKHLKTYKFMEVLTPAKLDLLAEFNGTKGNQAKREKRIQQERQAYRNFVASIEDRQNQKQA